MRTKIDRAFTDKKNIVLRGLDTEISVIRAKAAEEFTENLRALSEDKNYSPEFAKIIIRLTCEYNHANENPEEAGKKLATKFTNKELESLQSAAIQARNDNDRAKEEFLIAVSYAGGDIGSIKEVFTKYGLTF